MSHDLEVAEAARQVLARGDAQQLSEILVVSADGALSYVMATELFRSLSSQFATRALTDGLTGLANRDLFLDQLDRSCERVNAGHGRVGVLFIDLDGFKSINDAYGHNAGDQALRRVAERLRACFREQDLIARLGGDEFAVIMSLATTSEAAAARTAQELAARTLKALTERMDLRGAVIPGRASIGLAVSAEHGADGETLLREADLAMYRAKASGGSAVDVVRGVGTALSGQDRRPDQQLLRRALAAGEFVLHYQPIVEVHTKQLASIEALVRWAHPERGLLAPSEFLDGIEEAGLSVELGTYVLRTACAQLASWRRVIGAAAPPAINVNLSVRQLLDDALAPTVLEILATAGIPARLLRLELPEVATMTHMRQARGALETLRAAGVAITLDDLGPARPR